MSYEKISPLGKRSGLGTYETFFDAALYGQAQAIIAKKAVIVDFVKDEQGTIYFELYHAQAPEDKLYHRLMIQHFPFGVDTRDDHSSWELAKTLLAKYQ